MDELSRISINARRAVQARDWATVEICAGEILKRDSSSAEGYFLSGLVHKVANRPIRAAQAFEKALELDENRYDAAVELASQYSIMRRNGDTAGLLARYEGSLENSPVYLDLAGTVYVGIGLPQRAWPLYKQAVKLQPGVDLFQANLAACAVFLGKIDEARPIYENLLRRFPNHRRNHYELSRLGKATDRTHIDQMKTILQTTSEPPANNVFMYYAIAKELEDLGAWDEAFEYYKMGGDAVMSVADYDVDADIRLIDTIIDTCDRKWLSRQEAAEERLEKTPIFIVGLPRTGTTLTERIVSSHSRVETLGETQFLQMVLRRESGVASKEPMIPEMIKAVSRKDMSTIGRGYLDAVAYRLGDQPMFIDKLPFNFLFLGFIARAFPDARIISLRRNPMDACFSMYKQVFTWAYKFSYSLENLGRYYVAHHRLENHWRELLGARMIEVDYEELVTDQEEQTRILLDRLDLPFEQACLDFDRNVAPSTTASSVQVREKVHTQSVKRWTQFEKQLAPLKACLEEAGIEVQ